VDNRLWGLSIENPQPFVVGGAKPAAVLLAYGDSAVESCTLRGSDKGVRLVDGVRNTVLRGCLFVDNGIGIFVDGAGTGNIVERCLVTENVVGVMMFTHGADFGGGDDFSMGGNAFVANDTHDFVNATGDFEPARAEGCFWDHSFPTMAAGSPANPADADVWIVSNGNVVVTGAQLYDPLSPIPDVGGVAP
jgi:parallel beta-helix repeat protein